MVLTGSQAQRPNEDVTWWIYFFFSALKNIQVKLEKKLESTGVLLKLDPKEKSILAYISDHPGTRSGTISAKSGIPVPTVKRLINNLFTENLFERFGDGPGTNYSIK